MDNSKIIGAIFDGLKDRISIYPEQNLDNDKFYLSDVVLPETLSGKMLIGNESETSRICSGLSWPSEAAIKEKEFIRRVPISLAWRILIDNGGTKSIHWNSSQSASFKLSKIISTHIISLLKNHFKDPKNQPDRLIISIPNDLNEIAQERLIREIINSKLCPKEKLNFLWTPIAAALEWLNNTQDKITEDPGQKDFILSAYFGAESFEFAPLQLRKRDFDGKRFIIPLRDIPKENFKTDYCGVHWVSQIINKIVTKIEETQKCNNKKGVFWQLFTGIPDIWMNLANMKYNEDELPRALNLGDLWTLWNPLDQHNVEILNKKQDIIPDKSSLLENIILNSLKSIQSNGEMIFANSELNYLNISELIYDKFKKAMYEYSGKCIGIIISGPFSYFFVDKCLPLLKEIIISKMGNAETTIEFKPFTIWFENKNNEIITKGALEYGRRIINNQPKYLDTVTQIKICARKDGKICWTELLKPTMLEIEGGKPEENILNKNLKLMKKTTKLDIILQKETEKNYYRYKEFVFPYPPKKDVVFDTKILTSGAGGTIQIELLPDNKEFLVGKQIYLDYSEMEIINKQKFDELVKPKPSYPPVKKRISDPNYFMPNSRVFHESLDTYSNTSLTTLNKLSSFNYSVFSLTGRLKAKRKISDEEFLPILDVDGNTLSPHAKTLITQISKKLDADILSIINSNELFKYNANAKSIIIMLFKMAKELYCSAPNNIKSLLRLFIKSHGNLVINGYKMYLDNKFNDFLLYGSYIFSENDDIKLVFDSVLNYISDKSLKSKLSNSRALYNLLIFRENAVDVLNIDMANIFLKYAEETIASVVKTNEPKYKDIFFENIGLIISLLRYRKKDKTFLNPEDKLAIELIENISLYLSEAKNHINPRKKNKLEELTELAISYLRGYEVNIPIDNVLDNFLGKI